jgi:hypothetical protein
MMKTMMTVIIVAVFEVFCSTSGIRGGQKCLANRERTPERLMSCNLKKKRQND